MYRYLTIGVFAVLLLFQEAVSQTTRQSDVLLLKNNSRIEAIIMEVSSTEIKYKKATDPDGPTFTTKKSELKSITYGNGEEEVFVRERPVSSNASATVGTLVLGWDVIETKNKGPMNVRVVGTTSTDIRYRKTLDKSSPVFTFKKSDASKIVFANGEVDDLTGPPREEIPNHMKYKEAVEEQESLTNYQDINRPTPRNDFQYSIANMPNKDLRLKYDYHKRKASQGKAGGIVWTILTVATPIAGVAAASASYSDEATDGWIIFSVLAPLACAPFAIAGWVNGAKHSNKAKFIRSELGLRGVPVSFKVSPQFNMQNKTASLSARLTF